MANEEREPDNIESFLTVDSANNEGTSLESTSASESATTSIVTQVESLSSPVQVVETSNQINFQDAKEAKSQEVVVENQSSSSKDLPTPGPNCGESEVASYKDDANLEFGSGGGESSSMYTSIPEKEDFEEEEDEGRRGGEEEEDQSYDEDTLSSEAVVDDIGRFQFCLSIWTQIFHIFIFRTHLDARNSARLFRSLSTTSSGH
jgi:general stress protein YciG